MKKIIITQNQYKTLLENEQKRFITEAEEPVKTDINILLGVCLLLGLKVTGHNKERAENALKDLKVLTKIKTYVEDKEMIKELIESLESKGMSNPIQKLNKNVSKFISKFNSTAKENNLNIKLSSKALTNLHALGVD